VYKNEAATSGELGRLGVTGHHPATRRQNQCHSTLVLPVASSPFRVPTLLRQEEGNRASQRQASRGRFSSAECAPRLPDARRTTTLSFLGRTPRFSPGQRAGSKEVEINGLHLLYSDEANEERAKRFRSGSGCLCHMEGAEPISPEMVLGWILHPPYVPVLRVEKSRAASGLSESLVSGADRSEGRATRIRLRGMGEVCSEGA